MKKLIDIIHTFFNYVYNKLLLNYKNVSFQEFPTIRGGISVFRNGKIILGNNIKINSGKNYNPIGGDVRTVFSVAKGAVLKIGDNTGISNSTFVCKKNITIGKHVKIGGGTKIYDTDFHSLNYINRSKGDTDIPINKAVEIKDYAFIGAHSIILKGVTIGEKSIIGAGSIVTKSVPDRQIWGGNPAKYIKDI